MKNNLNLSQQDLQVKVEGEFNLFVHQAGDNFVAKVDLNNLQAFGKTQDEAIAALLKQFQYTVETAYKENKLEEILAKSGWNYKISDDKKTVCLQAPLRVEVVNDDIELGEMEGYIEDIEEYKKKLLSD